MSAHADTTDRIRGGETIHISGALTLKEAAQVTRLIIPLRKRLVLYALVCGFFLIVVGAFRPPYPYGPIVFLGLIACFFFLKARLDRRAYRERRGFYGDTHFEFDDQGVRVTTSDSEIRLKWQAFSEVLLNDRFIILFITSRANYLPLARSWCAKDDQWERLGTYIRDHAPRPDVGKPAAARAAPAFGPSKKI